MNQFKNGTLLVIVATVVISALMLMTGKDNAPISNTENKIATDEKEVNVIVAEKVDAADVKENSVESENSVISVEDKNVADEEKITLVSNTPPVEIMAPEGPYTSDENDSDKVVNETSENDTQAISDSEVSQAPDESIQLESINAVATSTQHDLLNHLIQPIWMDQKLGDFKSIEKGEVVFKIIPTNPSGLQGEDPKKVVTSKSDKFAPTTVSADYNYQQMPMYNGGYYITPMPPYLMQSVLPGSPINTDN